MTCSAYINVYTVLLCVPNYNTVIALHVVYIILTYIGTYVCMFVHVCISNRYFKQVATVGVIYLLVVHSAKTVLRNRDW